MFDLIVLFVIISLIITETCLSGFWVSFYFQYGIPIFRKSFSYLSRPTAPIDAERLSGEFKQTWVPSMSFRRLNSNEIAFREKAFEFSLLSYTPIMHGLIQFEDNRGLVTIIGRVNWIIIWFSIIFLGNVLSGLVHEGYPALLFLLFGLLFFLPLLGVLYIIQYIRFNAIVEKIRKEYNAGIV